MYKPTVGLEIHIELNTKTKMFCSCSNDPDQKQANFNICPVCSAQPGTLPTANEEAIKKVIKTGLALDCKISENSFFERKNYFYPDLPKGYQISQYQAPLCGKGFLEIKIQNLKKIGVTRIHLEEDTGRLLHPAGNEHSLVDFNRAGVPLMELVTEPDIESSMEAGEFVKELQLILRYLGVSEANMEKGQLRAEVNISLRDVKSSMGELGTKVEIKNLNSIRAVEKSIEYEIKRQTEVLEKGEKIIQETRGWDDVKAITYSQRSKEEAYDYRYFPEPDLSSIRIGQDYLNKLKAEIPELPNQKRKRFQAEYGLFEKENELYASRQELGNFFEKVVSELREWVGAEKGIDVQEEEFKKIAKIASNYLATDLVGIIRDLSGLDDEYLFANWGTSAKASPENLAEFIKMIYLGQISSKIAKMVLLEMAQTAKDPSQIIEDHNWQMVSDEGEIEKAAKEVIAENPKPVEDFKKGKEASMQFLVGKVMAKTKGKAKPEMVMELLKKLL